MVTSKLQACCCGRLPVPVAHRRLDPTSNRLVKPSSSSITVVLRPSVRTILLTSEQRWNRPEAIASELLHSAQASSSGITPLPELDTLAPVVSSRLNSLSSLAITEPTGAKGSDLLTGHQIERSAILIYECQFSKNQPFLKGEGNPGTPYQSGLLLIRCYISRIARAPAFPSKREYQVTMWLLTIGRP